MASQIFTNKDLNKPLSQMKPAPTSKIYTNADLDVEDDFQPDDDFVSDNEDDFIPDQEPVVEQSIVSKNRGFVPATDDPTAAFARSVLDSIVDAPEQLKEYARGAILDLPEAIMGIPKFLGQGAALASGPIGEMITGRSTLDRLKGIGETFGEMGKITTKSGTEPRPFARMMGQLTGQPIIGEAIVKGAPPVIRGAGYPTETAGRIMRKYQPLSGTLPRLMEPRIARTIERAVGSGVEKLGARMKQVGKKPTIKVVNGKVVSSEVDPFVEGDIITPDMEVSYRRELPPIGGTSTAGDWIRAHGKTTESKGSRLYRDFIDEQNKLPVDDSITTITEGQELPKKPKVRYNPKDRTYTDLNTGEVYDSTGKNALPGSKITDKPVIEEGQELTRDSSFFNKNRPIQVTKVDPLAKLDVSSAEVGGKTVMGITDRKAMIQMFKKTYKGSANQTAGKELIQNAIDAAAAKGEAGNLDMFVDGPNKTITVMDNGNGVPLDFLKTGFIDLTGSGKRGGSVKTIGEMGVGKVTYLATGEKVSVRTVVREADGQLMQHEFIATPEQIIDEGIDVKSTPVPEGTPTGTEMIYKSTKDDNFRTLERYVDNLSKYSGAPVPFKARFKPESWEGRPERSIIINQKTEVPTKLLAEGKDVANNAYKISIPDNAIYAETDNIKLILNNRGMFQGVQEMPIEGKYVLPDRLVIDLDPGVSADHNAYPLTAPTREAMTYTTGFEVRSKIKDLLVEGEATKKREELARIFKQLEPPAGKKFAIVDRDGIYSPEQIEALHKNAALHALADISNEILTILSEKFKDRMLGSIKSFGYVLDEKTRGINVKNPIGEEFSIMLNPRTLIQSARTPTQFANAVIHVLGHEFTHNMIRNEGADFTAALADTFTIFGPEEQLPFYKRLVKDATERGNIGEYNPSVQKLLQETKRIEGMGSGKSSTLLDEYGSKIITRKGQTKTGNSGSINAEGNRKKGLTNLPILEEGQNLSKSKVNLPAELISVGDESSYNAPRLASRVKYLENIDDIAEAGSRVAGKRRLPAGNISSSELSKMMLELAKARKR